LWSLAAIASSRAQSLMPTWKQKFEEKFLGSLRATLIPTFAVPVSLIGTSVFVPVAFIPGISGEPFRQFAVTVAVSMLLSAINALTLSPALCGVLLRPSHGPRSGAIGLIMR
jgi:multidrug efflux pump subunit AcrB